MKDNYITAVLEKIKTGDSLDKIIKGLQSTLKERGHQRLYAPILRGVLKVLEATGTNKITVVVPNDNVYEKELAKIKEALAELAATGEPEVVIDPTIVGGWLVEANNKILDKSYKTKLVNLYRALTT